MTQPRIVVLDGATLNPGDNPWTELAALGDLIIYDRTPPHALIAHSENAAIVVVNKVRIAREQLQQLPTLRCIAITATGTDCVDKAAARKHGICVVNVPQYGTDSVAQFVFALLLEVCHHVALHDRAIRGGEWSRANNFCFWKTPLVELAGRTVGIVGFGRIGRRVGEIAHALGMSVLAHSPRVGDVPSYKPFAWAGLEELFARSNVISLHCPSTAQTRGMVNAELLRHVRPETILLNTSRGDLIVENDLAEALDEGVLAAAAVDVVSAEPIQADNPLLKARNCLITPHIAWATLAARQRLMACTVANVASFLAGAATNVVNP